jgi:hypothetical protein
MVLSVKVSGYSRVLVPNVKFIYEGLQPVLPLPHYHLLSTTCVSNQPAEQRNGEGVRDDAHFSCAFSSSPWSR